MLSFKADGGRLSILRGGREIYTAAPGDVPLIAGIGKNSYKMVKGSFKIKERTAATEPLTVKSVSLDGENKAEIIFSEGRAALEIQGDKLTADFQGLDEYNRLILILPAVPDEHVYGTGETFSEFDLRGKKTNNWVAEHENARCISKKVFRTTIGFKDGKRKEDYSKYETYYAQPTFISSRKYWFHSETTARSEFDFRRPDRHILKFDSVAGFSIGFGDSFEQVLGGLTAHLGRQIPLPEWVYDGAILGIQGGTDIMLGKVDACLARGTPVCGVWIQDWEGRRVTAFGKQLQWNWQWDKELYPGLDKAIKDLGEKGIRVLGYCNPFLAIEKPLYKIASEKGYCVKNAAGEDYMVTITTFPAAMIDLTNPDAREWLKGIIKENMIAFGLSGWMADFAEYLPTDAVLFSGEDAEAVHNTWPARWAKLNREAIREAGKEGEIMFFTRAGYSGTPKYSTMMWNGDNHVDFSIDYGMPSVIPAMLSLTCSGFGLSHSDTGGYTTFKKFCRTEELYMRWCEMNAFSPLMRSHEGNNPDINAQFDASEETLSHQAVMSRVHVALKPYIKSAVEYNAETGTGVVRPLFFYYDEEKAYTEAYEYLLGRDILVAPVLERGAATRRVYLPNDEWIRFGTGEEYGGGEFTVDAPIGRIPVFYRKNASQDVINTIKSAEEKFNEILS